MLLFQSFKCLEFENLCIQIFEAICWRLMCSSARNRLSHVHCFESCQSTSLWSFLFFYSFALNTSFCFRSLAALKSCYMQTAFKSILMFSFQLKSHILDQDLYKFLSWRLFFRLLLTTSFHLRKKRRRKK